MSVLPPAERRPLTVRPVAEVSQEIARLRALAPQLPHRDEWGNNLRRAVAAQLLALRQKWTWEDLAERRARDPLDHNGAVNEYEFGEARDAILWRENESDYAPSSGWLLFIAQQGKP